MKHIIKGLGLLLLLILIGCSSGAKTNRKNDPFLVTANSVGIFKRGMTIGQAVQLVPPKQIKKTVGSGEFFEDAYDDYEIYDSENRHILTVTPKNQNDRNSIIATIQILDDRFKTKSGISLKSTYSELLQASNVSKYEPMMDAIAIIVEELHATFSIDKTKLEPDWFDWEPGKQTGKINPSKIPLDAHLETFVIFWEF